MSFRAEHNPVSIKVEVRETDGAQHAVMKLSLLPDAIGLRAKYRGLLLHLSNAPHPVFWDLGKQMELMHTLPCYGPLPRINITCYGLRNDNLLEMIFRNWGTPADGLPLPAR